MKYFLSAILLAFLLFWGCEQSSDPLTGPNSTLDKSTISSNDLSNKVYSMITLPNRSPIFQDSVFQVSKVINGLFGGSVILNKTYISENGKLVTMLVNLEIPPLAFTGNKNIVLTIDSCFAAVQCEPGMRFRLPLIMTQTFTGLNLKGHNAGDINFVYIKDNGGIEEIPFSIKVVEPLTGTLSVIGAQIPHFSRYGWVR